jgi:hypothetical protein
VGEGVGVRHCPSARESRGWCLQHACGCHWAMGAEADEAWLKCEGGDTEIGAQAFDDDHGTHSPLQSW